MKKTTKTNEPKLFRQGDVLIMSTTDSLPEGAKEIPLTGMGPVLALGEVTGHHHTVVAFPETYKPFEDLTRDVVEELGASLAEHAQAMLDSHNVDPKLAAGEPAAKLYSFDGSEDRMLVVSRGTLLRHDEHGAVWLDQGNYMIRRQREFSPEGWKTVQD